METTSLACPRCKRHIHLEDNAESVTAEYLRCPNCDIEFHRHEFEKQIQREGQKKAINSRWQQLLSDTPSDRTTQQNVTMSFSEWVKWKFGHRKTEATLLLRFSIHQVLAQCCELYKLYPAIPRQLRNEHDLRKFLTDPEHLFIIGSVAEGMRSANYLAEEFFRKGLLTRGDIRQIIDMELPHSNWAGLAVTYSVHKPEIRGLLLAFMMLKAHGLEIPKLFQQIQSWFLEDGWDEHGLAIQNSSATTAPDSTA
ncbi:MAG TPA: hypothetical protein VF791_03835 [Pyrinomonadaceae bacterium]